MADSPFYLFGIRHHGPGCARSLLAALQELQPDCVLIEGPPEGEAVLEFIAHETMEPPVALLVFNPDNSQQAAFYPFAQFSPEWQALQFSYAQQVPVRFMDLSLSHAFALTQNAKEQEALALVETIETDSIEKLSPDENENAEINSLFDVNDPLDWLGRAAGYDNGEAWWNHLVEERNASLDLFAAIREAMISLRSEVPTFKRNADEKTREQLREASMRKTMRQAQKEGFTRIAVICGAWHLPALENLPSAKADNDLFKALPKVKTSATWVPWSYPHLSYRSGYGAGVISPQWYEHVWQFDDGKKRAIHWLTRAAHLLRAEDIDCSSAHIIEAMRFAESLAALRERPQAGLDELLEGLRTTLCMGNEAPIRLIEQQLIVGNRLGRIPAEVPGIPLQRDLEQQQKSLRLKADVAQKALDLDLRQENDLARSHLLHRLNLVGIDWGQLNKTGRSAKGSFHEIWTLQWDPQFSLALIDASIWGNSIITAATAKVVQVAETSRSLTEIAELLNKILLADLPDAITKVSHSLEDLAATSSDIVQLLNTITPLVQIARYGNVRNTDVILVNHIISGLVPRAAIALVPACQALDDDAANSLRKNILKAHQAIRLLDNDDLNTAWLATMASLARLGLYHGLISGLATRLLFDTQTEDTDAVQLRMSQALSIGIEPVTAANWLEGFLNDSGMILLHDDHLWQLVNNWLVSLHEDYFLQILPLIRRSFATFSAPERRQLGERANQTSAAKPVLHMQIDQSRAEQTLPLLRQLLGVV